MAVLRMLDVACTARTVLAVKIGRVLWSQGQCQASPEHLFILSSHPIGAFRRAVQRLCDASFSRGMTCHDALGRACMLTRALSIGAWKTALLSSIIDEVSGTTWYQQSAQSALCIGVCAAQCVTLEASLFEIVRFEKHLDERNRPHG